MGKKRKRSVKNDGHGHSPAKHPRNNRDSYHHHPVISSFYPSVLTLRQYLLLQLPLSSKSRRRRVSSLGLQRDHQDDDGHGQENVDRIPNLQVFRDQSIADLLDSTLVGMSRDCSSNHHHHHHHSNHNDDQNNQNHPNVNQTRRREFIAFTQSQSQLRSSLACSDTGPTCAQSEIVDFVISSLFNRDRFSYQKPQHLLAHGYRRAAASTAALCAPDQEPGAFECSIPGVVKQYPNQNVLSLKQSPWADVLGLLGSNGEDIMMRLLFDCGIFTCIDKQKHMFYQISGVPLSVLKPLDQSSLDTNYSTENVVSTEGTLVPAKDPKQARMMQRKGGSVLHKPNSIVFVRRRMLYARPALNAKKEVRFGLRHIHVLNRFPSSDSLPQTVHVMKYIFPRQFGLHNVFASKIDTRETAQPLKDYTLREDEIFHLEKEKRRRRHLPVFDVDPDDGMEHGAREATKVPKRLRGMAVGLVQKLQSRNQRCAYNELLRHYCPLGETGPWKLGLLGSQSDNDTPKSSLSSTIPEQLVTQTRCFGQQRSDNAPGHAHTEYSRSPRTIPQPKTSLTDYATPSASVSAFCRAVLRKLVPLQFFGVGAEGIRNRNIVFMRVDRFIRMRRFESLSLHEACEGLKVSLVVKMSGPVSSNSERGREYQLTSTKITCIPWLEPPNSSPDNIPTRCDAKLSLSDLQKRTELFHEFIYYLFDSILIPLIRTNFYVTESQIHRNRLFYFRHDVWRHLTEGPLQDLQSSIFEELKRTKAQHILFRRPLGYGALRLLPKSTGVRPVLNLRRRMIQRSQWSGRKSGGGFLGPSINSIVTPVYNMLNYEKERDPMRLGSALYSVQDIHPRLKGFKERLQRRQRQSETTRNTEEGKPLYFVKLDIKSCFDTIPQDKLISLIERIVSEDSYHVAKHVEIVPSQSGKFGTGLLSRERERGKPFRKFVGRAMPANKPQHLPDFITSRSTIDGEKGTRTKKQKTNTVFADTLAQKKHSTDELLDLLEEHVRNNLVKIGKRYYRQRNGIPQGSVLSSLLCNYFYGELEHKVLGFLQQQADQAQLLRLVDDFLLITSDAELAMRFLRVMMNGQPAYGISVNASKSLVNFEAEVNGIRIPRLMGTRLFPYCGSLIDTNTLEVHKDQERMLDGDGDGNGNESTAAVSLSNALTVETARVPGRSFHRKTLATFKLQMHSMYLDTSHNSAVVVLSNLYAGFVTAAMKMYRYMRSLRGGGGSSRQVTMTIVIRIIDDLMKLADMMIQTTHKSSTTATATATGSISINQAQIRYLAAAAFRLVLGRKQTRYAEVMRWLEVECKRARPRTDGKAVRLGQVVRRGNMMFGGWRF